MYKATDYYGYSPLFLIRHSRFLHSMWMDILTPYETFIVVQAHIVNFYAELLPKPFAYLLRYLTDE